MDAYSPGLSRALARGCHSPTLTKGKLYVITVQGTVSFYAAVDYLQIQKPFIAFCGKSQAGAPVRLGRRLRTRSPTTPSSSSPSRSRPAPAAAMKLPLAYPNFQVNNGFGWGHPTLLSPKPVRRPTANHAYSFAIVGQGKPPRPRARRSRHA